MKYPARTVLFSCAIVLPTLASSRIARADDAQAETLYQEGRRAAQAKDWATACKKFKESIDRESAPGTLLNLADCEENRGKLRDAFVHFESAVRMFPRGDERVRYASDRASALERRLSKLTVSLPSSVPTGTSLEIDGAAVDRSRVGTAIPVDAGEHVVVVRAPGRSDVRSSLKLAQGEARQISLDVGPASSSGSSPAPVFASSPSSSTAPASVNMSATSSVASDRRDTKSPLRTAGFVSLGVGAVGLGVGILGGLMTLNAKNTADEQCPPTTNCTKEGLDAQSQGKTWSTIGTVGFVTAGVGALTGAGLLVLASTSRSSGQTVVGARPIAGGTALTLAGSF